MMAENGNGTSDLGAVEFVVDPDRPPPLFRGGVAEVPGGWVGGNGVRLGQDMPWEVSAEAGKEGARAGGGIAASQWATFSQVGVSWPIVNEGVPAQRRQRSHLLTPYSLRLQA